MIEFLRTLIFGYTPLRIKNQQKVEVSLIHN